MKKVLIAALVGCIAAVAAESSAAPQADDAIKQVLGQLDRCFAKNDATCVGEMFVDDATYAAPTDGAKIIKGRAQILKALAESMAAVNKAGWKLTHAIDNVRMIGDDHAFVDTTVKISGMKPAEEANAARDSYRAVAIMVLQKGTWLCEDLRSYVIGPTQSAQQGSAPPAKPGSVPPTEQGAAPPTGQEPPAPKMTEPAPPTQG